MLAQEFYHVVSDLKSHMLEGGQDETLWAVKRLFFQSLARLEKELYTAGRIVPKQAKRFLSELGNLSAHIRVNAILMRAMQRFEGKSWPRRLEAHTWRNSKLMVPPGQATYPKLMKSQQVATAAGTNALLECATECRVFLF